MSVRKFASILSPDTPVLIVDDSVQFASVLKKMLEAGMGYRAVTHVETISAGLALLREKPGHYGLLFADFRFPDGVTGGDFLTQLSREELLTHTVSFLITSEPSSENMKQARDAGAFAVIAKPFNREILKQQLERAEAALKADSIEYF